MPSRPSNITRLVVENPKTPGQSQERGPSKVKNSSSSEALHVLNQLFREIHGRLDDIEKKVPTHQQLKASGTLVFGTLAPQSAVEATLYVGNANTAGVVHVSPAQGLSPGNANLMWSARVSQQNQVAIRLLNPTSGSVVVNTIKWNVLVIQ